jgi:hypothetical protein
MLPEPRPLCENVVAPLMLVTTAAPAGLDSKTQMLEQTLGNGADDGH